jgi:pilus assembly protein Flp/PilA
MKNWLINFFKDEDGLTMVEYAVAGGLITIGAYLAFQTLGNDVSTRIGDIDDAVNGTAAP